MIDRIHIDIMRRGGLGLPRTKKEEEYEIAIRIERDGRRASVFVEPAASAEEAITAAMEAVEQYASHV